MDFFFSLSFLVYEDHSGLVSPSVWKSSKIQVIKVGIECKPSMKILSQHFSSAEVKVNSSQGCLFPCFTFSLLICSWGQKRRRKRSWQLCVLSQSICFWHASKTRQESRHKGVVKLPLLSISSFTNTSSIQELSSACGTAFSVLLLFLHPTCIC